MASLLQGRHLGSLICANVDWKAFLHPAGVWPPKYFSHMQPITKQNGGAPLEVKAGPQKNVETLEWVLFVASEVIGELDVDEPLMSAGMDSLSAVELRRRLSSEKNLHLPSTVAFDHPTVRAISEFVDQQCKPSESIEGISFEASHPQRACFAGVACRFPGNGCTAATPQQAWTDVFQKQADAVGEIPLQRFDVNEFFDSTASGVGFLTYARHASFFDGVDLFDNRFFGISSNEAAAIDPQQRHTLEVAYAACHEAGRSRKQLMKTSILGFEV